METDQDREDQAGEERIPRMEDIHPRMTAAEKARALQEIMRILRGEE